MLYLTRPFAIGDTIKVRTLSTDVSEQMIGEQNSAFCRLVSDCRCRSSDFEILSMLCGVSTVARIGA
jgi:hypothetical protein